MLASDFYLAGSYRSQSIRCIREIALSYIQSKDWMNAAIFLEKAADLWLQDKGGMHSGAMVLKAATLLLGAEICLLMSRDPVAASKVSQKISRINYGKAPNSFDNCKAEEDCGKELVEAYGSRDETLFANILVRYDKLLEDWEFDCIKILKSEVGEIN